LPRPIDIVNHGDIEVTAANVATGIEARTGALAGGPISVENSGDIAATSTASDHERGRCLWHPGAVRRRQ
jgi:hypothetical protein